ncbi:hypothetical protein MW887_008768 [Aspergillus wentii]|nr:hypothetical protein MW887_008768 [Aspergillus wentii]
MDSKCGEVGATGSRTGANHPLRNLNLLACARHAMNVGSASSPATGWTPARGAVTGGIHFARVRRRADFPSEGTLA